MADPFYYETALAISGRGVDGAASVISESLGSLEFVASAGASVVLAGSKFGDGALTSNGTGLARFYASVPAGFLTRLRTSEFTIQFWLKTAATAGYVWSHAGGLSMLLTAGNLGYNTAGFSEFNTTTPINDNAWHHIAFVRSYDPTSRGRLFVDGVLVQNAADTRSQVVNSDAAGELSLLAVTGGSNRLVGAVEDFSIVYAPLYNASFTPPTAPHGSGSLPLNYSAPIEIVDLGIAEPMPEVTYASETTDFKVYDAIWGGNGRVSGTVKLDGTPTDTPVRRRVRLFRDLDAMLVREQWSHAVTGAYDFPHIHTGYTYTVLTNDHTGNFRAVVADNIIPDTMP